MGDIKGKSKKGWKMHNPLEPKKRKRKKLVPLMVGSYFTHGPSMSLACKLWDLIVMGGLEQTSFANTIFLSITEVETHWRVILTHYLKSWMQK